MNLETPWNTQISSSSKAIPSAFSVNRGGNLSWVVFLCATARSSWSPFDWKHMAFTFHGNEPFNDGTPVSETLEI